MQENLFQNTQRIIAKAAETCKTFHKGIVEKGGVQVFWGYLVFMLLLCLTALFLMILVQMRLESFELGYRIARLEKQREVLREEIHTLQYEITALTSPEKLLEENKNLKLELVPPEEWMEVKK